MRGGDHRTSLLHPKAKSPRSSTGLLARPPAHLSSHLTPDACQCQSQCQSPVHRAAEPPLHWQYQRRRASTRYPPRPYGSIHSIQLSSLLSLIQLDYVYRHFRESFVDSRFPFPIFLGYQLEATAEPTRTDTTLIRFSPSLTFRCRLTSPGHAFIRDPQHLTFANLALGCCHGSRCEFIARHFDFLIFISSSHFCAFRF